MKKNFLLQSLIKIANELDEKNFQKEAEQLTSVLIKLSQNQNTYTPNQIVYMAFKVFWPKF